ncbi:hypothetical protein BDY24DRAFT_397237 [Mrakia frigida]|uniref:uncharacterized protein n=1 Tax=Mrakia frigida TaxID=29902 RepID=UPI003FCBF4EF
MTEDPQLFQDQDMEALDAVLNGGVLQWEETSRGRQLARGRGPRPTGRTGRLPVERARLPKRKKLLGLQPRFDGVIKLQPSPSPPPSLESQDLLRPSSSSQNTPEESLAPIPSRPVDSETSHSFAVLALPPPASSSIELSTLPSSHRFTSQLPPNSFILSSIHDTSLEPIDPIVFAKNLRRLQKWVERRRRKRKILPFPRNPLDPADPLPQPSIDSEKKKRSYKKKKPLVSRSESETVASSSCGSFQVNASPSTSYQPSKPQQPSYLSSLNFGPTLSPVSRSDAFAGNTPLLSSALVQRPLFSPPPSAGSSQHHQDVPYHLFPTETSSSFTSLDKGKGRETDLPPLPLPSASTSRPVSAPTKKRKPRVYKDGASSTLGPGKKPRVGNSSNLPASFGVRIEERENGEGGEGSGSAGGVGGGEKQRPRLRAKPPVWAYSRQEMCETLPYWRAFQSGLYMLSGTAYGYLLDGYPSARDTWAHDGRVVISHGGGKCIEFDSPSPSDPLVSVKTVRLREDQSASDPRVSALLNSWRNRTPIVLVAGNNYQGMPFDLGCGYVVLGWYWISLVWIEAEPPAPNAKLVPGRDFFHRYKIRFDWVSSQGDPWWTIDDPSLPNGWDPQEESLALKKRRENLPEGVIPRMDATEDVQLSSTLSKDVEALDLTVASSSTSTSHSASPSPSPSPAIDVVSPKPAPEEEEEETPDRTKLSGLAGFLSTSSWSSSVGSQASSNFFDLVSASSPASSVMDEDVCMEDLMLGEEVVVEGAVVPMEKERRRLPGEGAARRLSSSLPLGAQALAEEPDEFTSARSHRTCSSCNRVSPFIYEQGWICVQLDCPRFFKILNPIDGTFGTPPDLLVYTQEFIAPVATPAKVQRLPHGIVPPPPVDLADIHDGLTSSRSFWRGMVCRPCGKASSRERWDCWMCTSCSAIYAPLSESSRVIKASELSRALSGPAFLGDDFLDPTSGISIVVSRHLGLDGVTPMAEVFRFVLPDGVGSIWHIKPYNLEPFDKVFESYQEMDATKEKTLASALFRRSAIKQHTSVGRLLTQQFIFNAGADYKFVVDQEGSLPFSESPWAVTESLRLIKETVHRVCGIAEEFNEVLSVAYKEDQKMNWHDDGETGLGPVVSSLSLGSDAEMSFRLKPARRDRNIVFHVQTNEPSASTTDLVDATLLDATVAVKPKRSKAPPIPQKPALTLRLMHGDFVVMEGDEVQRSWEHAVSPSGFRFAATARRITEEHGK